MPKAMRATSLGIICFGLFHSTLALADKVVVLPFRATEGAAPAKDVVKLATATSGAATTRGHTLVSAAEKAKAEKASKDGVFDTQAEFVAAGKAAQSNWTLSAKVEFRGTAVYALDLEACQVGTGRVESVARDVDLDKAEPQIAEMLALLLRPEGVAGAELPWKKNAPLPQIPTPEPVKETPKPPEPIPPPPPPQNMQSPAPPPRGYAEGHPFSGGLSAGMITALARPSGAVGNATSLLVQATFGYAFDSGPRAPGEKPSALNGLELRFDAGGGTVGPGSIFFDGGARYALFVAQSPRLYLGPEAKIGAFVPFAGDKKVRFLGRAGAFIGFEITPEFSLEIASNVSVAPGGSGTLLFLDAALGAFYRF